MSARRIVSILAAAAAFTLTTVAAPGSGLAAGTVVRVDTLDVREVLRQREAHLDSLLQPYSTQLDTAGVRSAADSLDRGGAASIAARVSAARPKTPLGIDRRPLELTTYNRVEGVRIGSGVQLRLGGDWRATGSAAYAQSSHRWSGIAALQRGRVVRGPVLRAEWSDLVRPFGPNQGEMSTSVLAFVAGQDRQDYLHQRAVALELQPWHHLQQFVGLTSFVWRERSVRASTRFSLVGGGTPIEAPNPAVDAGESRGLAVSTRLGRDQAWAHVDAGAGIAGGALGGDFEYAWQRARLVLRRVLPEGGTLSLRLEGANVAGSPPVQALPYLGGDSNLRGYDRLEFAGKQLGSARIEYRVGHDLLARTHIPLVSSLQLQFIPFADLGTTWGEVRGVATSRGTLHGDVRSSFGLGVERDLWLPGLEAIRIDLTRRADGAGRGLSWWLRPVHLDL